MRNLKRVLSLALALVMVLGMMVITTSAADFTDADEITYTEAMDVMAALGVFKGNSDGTVAPTQVLTRKEAAVIVARIILGDDLADKLAPTKQIFDDVPLTAATEWYAAEVEYCNNINMIVGHNGKFNPDGKLTGTEFAKLLLCAMGYDADAQGYVGAKWDTNINADAMRIGLNIDGVLLTAELTREGAAQMLLQALKANMVEYEKSFDKATGADILVGPNKVTEGYFWNVEEVLFMDEYFDGLEYDETDSDLDNWGRPYDYAWFYNDDCIYAEAYEPVLTYTEAVSECDLAKDLGLKRSAKATVTVNGNADVDNTINTLGTNEFVGAQGRLTEVYVVDGNAIEIVMIDTFLAKVTKVQDRTFDKNGHLDKTAKLYLNIYDGAPEDGYTYVTLESAVADYEYAKGDMLWVYAETKDADDDTVDYSKDYQCVEIQGYADAFEGKLNSFNGYYETSKISGETFDWAIQYHEGNTGSTGKNYIVYTDMYGNLLGLVEPSAAAATYTILDSGVFVTNGFRPYYAAKVLDMETGELVEVKVADYDADNAKEELVYWMDDDVIALNHIVSFESKKAGYVLADAADITIAADCDIYSGTPRIYANDSVVAVTDNYTVYVVEVAEGKFEMYTGYKNVPSIENAKNVEILMDYYGEYATLVYVDATKATYTGSVDVVYVLEGDVAKVGTGVSESNVPYDIYGGVVVNGDVSVVDTVKGFDLTAFEGKAVILFYNADGLVYEAVEYTFDAEDLDVKAVSEEVVYFKGIDKGYIVDESTVIWYIDEAKDYAFETTYLTYYNKNVYFDVAKDGKTLEFVIIIAD